MKYTRVVLICLFALFAGLTLGRCFTNLPWVDEGWFFDPVYNWIYHGHIGTTVMEGSDFRGMELSVTNTGSLRFTWWSICVGEDFRNQSGCVSEPFGGGGDLASVLLAGPSAEFPASPIRSCCCR